MLSIRGDEERGESLIEILLAIAILGACFAAVLAGIGTMVSSSDIRRQQAFDASYVRALAERIEAQSFKACTSEATVYSIDGVLPADSVYAVAIAKIEHWNGTTWQTSCPVATDDLQRITITVTPPDNRAAEPPLVVMKRRP